MTDIATLEIRVLSDGIDKANRRLETLERQGKQTERATDGIGKSFKSTTALAVGLVAPVGLLTAGIAGLMKLVNVTKEFGTLNAMLKTATGSAENAAIAFKGVQAFASQTPYDLQQATSAFLKLVNYGLTPSTEALMAYGDMASSMGKPLIEMIEAVADATTGEMERLKEFGVKAKQEGDKVSFTFRGITETVGRNSAEIEQYLINLAQKNFGGAMAEQMTSLGGTLANLEDSWTMLFYNISEQGIGDAIQSTVTVALEALNELNAQVASGELAANVNAYGGMWAEVAKQATSSFTSISGSLETEQGVWADLTKGAVEAMTEAFDYFPANVKASMEVVGTLLYGMVESGQIAAETAVDLMINEFDRLLATMKAVKMQIDSVMGGGVEINLANTITAISEQHNEKGLGILKSGVDQMATLVNQSNQQIDTALSGREEIISEYEKGLATAAELRAKYDKGQQGTGADTLGQFGVKPATATGGKGAGAGGGGGSGVDKGLKEFEKLVKQMQDEEVTIQESYDRRTALIAKYAEEGSELQADMSAKSLELATDELSELAAMRAKEGEDVAALYLLQEELLQTHYDERKRIILESTQTTEEEKNALLEQLDKQRAVQEDLMRQAKRGEEAKQRTLTVKDTANFFGNLSAIAGAFGKKGHKASQALAIAETTINTASAAMAAYKSLASIPYVGPVLGAAAAGAAIAYGAGQIAQIKSAEYQGAYEHGGMISAGKYGLVGEAGAELVRGPAMVTSARTTAAAMSANQGDSKPVILNIYNLPGQTVETKENTGPNGEKQIEVIIKRVEAKLASDAQSGGGVFVPKLANAFGLSRAR